MPSWPLSCFTTLGVGGPAQELIEVATTDALADALGEAEGAGRPVLVLGSGSNVVVPDQGFAGTVVRVAIPGVRLHGPGPDGRVLVDIGAGEDWAALVERCVGEGLSGIEALSGIPGSAGATPVQNVGAYGQEVSQVVEQVTVWDRRARRVAALSGPQCHFGYRQSVFKGADRYVVTEVRLSLERSGLAQPVAYLELAGELGLGLGQRAALTDVAQAVISLRRRKGMVLDASDPDTRSAGSFFINPILTQVQISHLRALAPGVPSWPVLDGAKVPAAWLVENAGFHKGYQHGTAAISSKHALALTVRPGGTASDLLALARLVRDGVSERFGVVLQPEPLLVSTYL